LLKKDARAFQVVWMKLEIAFQVLVATVDIRAQNWVQAGPMLEMNEVMAFITVVITPITMFISSAHRCSAVTISVPHSSISGVISEMNGGSRVVTMSVSDGSSGRNACESATTACAICGMIGTRAARSWLNGGSSASTS
jgi:hypothetical protein